MTTRGRGSSDTRKPCQTVLRNMQKAASIRNWSIRCVRRYLHISSWRVVGFADFPSFPFPLRRSACCDLAFRSSFVSEKRSMYSFSQPHEPRARRARAPPSAARRCHDSINIPERVWKLNTARRHRPRARGPARPRRRPRNSRIVDVDPYYHVYYTFNSRSVRHSSQGRRVHMQTPTMKTLRALIDLAISRCNI